MPNGSRWSRYGAVSAGAMLLLTLLLLALSPLRTQAAAGDEDWQGVVTIVNKSHAERSNKITTHPITREDASRRNDERRETYSDFRLSRANDDGTAWQGEARVNLNIHNTYYTFNSELLDASAIRMPNSYEEHGYDTTTSGSLTGRGEVKFYRYVDDDNPRVAKCRIEVDAVNDQRQNPEWTVWEVGRSWRKFVPAKPSQEYDKAVRESHIMAPSFTGFDFDCDPKGTSYSGSLTENTNPSGSSTQTVSWNIRRGSAPQTEVILIPPKSYPQWLPQGGESESASGGFIDIQVVAREQGKPGSSPPQEVRKFKVELVDVSREPGVCLNWPQSPSGKPAPDLKLDDENPYLKVLDKDRQSAETKQSGLEQFMVTVASHDWGAYGKLQVTAELKDGSTVQAHVENKPSTYALALPEDENSNHVADWWEHWFDLKEQAPEADADGMPAGDSDKGDSISLYEEYRGFRAQGKHERLSPEIKDIFIYDRDNLGLGLYGELGLQAHRVARNELTMRSGDGNQWVANGNHGSHSRATVWALRLVRYVIGDGAAGETEGGPGVPARIIEVRIDSARIAAAAGPYAGAELKSTIAHELGHATNIWHHGDGLDYQITGDVLCRKKNGTTKNFICSTGGCYQAAVQHGMFSGDDRCIMRYNSTNFYEDPAGNCEWKVGKKTVKGKVFGYDPPGTIYCESRKGTGVNDTTKKPNKAGDASADRGECIYRFCVNSEKH